MINFLNQIEILQLNMLKLIKIAGFLVFFDDFCLEFWVF